MPYTDYLSPISLADIDFMGGGADALLGDKITVYTQKDQFPDLVAGGLALLGVPEERGSEGNQGCAEAPNDIRCMLYRLAAPHDDFNMVDLGDLVCGPLLEDTQFALAEVLAELFAHRITVVLLGGGNHLTYGVYKAFEKLHQVVSICTVDAYFDLVRGHNNPSRNYIKDIIMQSPNYLFDLTNLGYQSYFVGSEYVNLMRDLRFEAYRLGEVQGNMTRCEAVVRNSDIVAVDINSVRMSDAPGQSNPSPHGLYGEQLCQITRFAGMSDKTLCLGIFEENPRYDKRHQTAHMLAHAIWYFIEGFYNRKNDFPRRDPDNYKRFMVQLKDAGKEIIFYKSKKTDRWWMEIPCENERNHDTYGRQLLVPCIYEDYQQAMENELPDLWWRLYERVNSL